jgi:hypothetical protein
MESMGAQVAYIHSSIQRILERNQRGCVLLSFLPGSRSLVVAST